MMQWNKSTWKVWELQRESRFLAPKSERVLDGIRGIEKHPTTVPQHTLLLYGECLCNKHPYEPVPSDKSTTDSSRSSITRLNSSRCALLLRKFRHSCSRHSFEFTSSEKRKSTPSCPMTSQSTTQDPEQNREEASGLLNWTRRNELHNSNEEMGYLSSSQGYSNVNTYSNGGSETPSRLLSRPRSARGSFYMHQNTSIGGCQRMADITERPPTSGRNSIDGKAGMGGDLMISPPSLKSRIPNLQKTYLSSISEEPEPLEHWIKGGYMDDSNPSLAPSSLALRSPYSSNILVCEEPNRRALV